MKMVYVIRHADKNRETVQLTDEGRQRAKILRERIGTFDIVLAGDRPRLVETAELLTGKVPELDPRAGFIYASDEQHQKLGALAKIHKFTHAGAMYENPEFEGLAITLGNNLKTLLTETINRLSENGKALIVSQDGVMVATEHILHDKPYGKLETSFKPLEGFTIDEDFIYKQLSI